MKNRRKLLMLLLCIVSLGLAFSLSAEPVSAASSGVNSFPASYRPMLKKLQKAHPKWVFVPVKTNLRWSDAYNRMIARPATNTVYYTFGYSYRSTAKGQYNYLKRRYTPADGTRFYAASPQAVGYYMDPRNWLNENDVFMFEDQGYHPDYQTLAAVQSIFRGRNQTLYKNASVFVSAGKKYKISPIYLAAKAIEEQGSKINAGTVGGKKVYNIFNIGAYDSASGGAKAGLRYARYGIFYQRPWTSVKKAIMGGAQYLASNFSTNNQNSHYLEHFNVMNGLRNVGTHVYMTAVYAPSNNARVTARNYKTYGLTNRKLVFRIPVYNNMPSTLYKAPSNSRHKGNNFYLKSLKLSAGGINYTLIKSTKLNYNTTFTRYVNRKTTTAKITTKRSYSKAKVSGAGTKKLKVGWNTFKIKVKSNSGASRTYTIKIRRF